MDRPVRCDRPSGGEVGAAVVLAGRSGRPVTFDQVTSATKTASCTGCRAVVKHVQVAGRTSSGFKVYAWVPVKHEKPGKRGACFQDEEIRRELKF